MNKSKRDKALSLLKKEFPAEIRSIIEIIGLEAVTKLLKARGGSSIYLPKWERMVKLARNRRIRDEFNGSNARELAIKYNLTEVWIRNIVNQKRSMEK